VVPRIRVLTLAKGLGPGGAERLILAAERARDPNRFEHAVAYLLPWKDALVEPLRASGAAVHCLHATRELNLRWALRLRRLLDRSSFDVVHVHSPYVAAIARLVIRSMDRKRRPALVSTEHNVWSSFAYPTRVANAATFPLGDAWLAVSADVRRSIPARLRERVEVLVHGIDLDEVRSHAPEREAVRAELGVSDDEVVAITVAHLRSGKGYPDLLAAARNVLDRQIPVRFLAVGQGPEEREVVNIHDALALGEQFRLLGYRSDALRLLAGADLFVLASRHEGLPVALMEAMALGLPVVATTVGGIPDVVTPGVEGLLVQPRRPELLADAIAELAVNPAERESQAAAATARASAFDVNRAVRRLEEVYSAVAIARDGRLGTRASLGSTS
jgi:glycosyltransferase involved in cell wall biosynthesis